MGTESGVSRTATRGLEIGSVRKYAVLSALALLGIGGAEVALLAAHRQTGKWVAHSRDVNRIARQASILALSREGSVNAFLGTRDPLALGPELAARDRLSALLDSLGVVTADNPSQRQRARDISAAVAAWNAGYAQLVLDRRLSRAEDARVGKTLFEPVRERFAEFIVAEDVIYEERQKRDDLLSLVSLLAIIGPVGLLATVLWSMGGRVGAQASELLQQQHLLEEQAIELEQQVAELEVTNKELSEAMDAAASAREAERGATAQRTRALALLDAAIYNAPIGIAFLDLDLRYTHVNRTMAAMRGMEPEHILGKRLEDIASPHNRQLAEDVFRRVLAGETVAGVRATTASEREGEPARRTVSTCYPVRGPDSVVIGAGFVIADETERVRLDEHMRQATKMEALGRLAGGVSHDFNNLLTVIRSYCDLVLLETSASDPRRDELQEIRNAADRAAALAKQLLAFSRKQVSIPHVLDLNEVVRGVDPMLGRLLPQEVKRVTTFTDGLGAIRVDAGQVEQVLMNLAINAADAMPQGGTLIIETGNASLDEEYARTHAGVKPGPYVMLAVHDTGTGMDDATLAHVFEPFFTTKPAGKGTGLGLATVYGIVEQNGGHVWVYSAVGKGTVFRIYFPRVEAEVTEDPSGPFSPRKSARRVAGHTVLVVDDEDAVRTTLVRILERQGYQVLGAAHGGEAMRLSATHDGPIHLVISDLHMPGMSGEDFVSRFAAVRPDARVLYMSGLSSDRADDPGAHPFIQKPFAIDELTRKVREVLEPV